jgi:dihydroflavonol-4-reductase
MILVTGGTGLIGSHLLYELVRQNKKVKALKRSTSKIENVYKIFSYYSENPEKLFSEIEWVEGDVMDKMSLQDVFPGISKVYHCAAMVSFNPGERKKMLEVNIEGTANIVNACLKSGIEKLCFVSSTAALGVMSGSEFVNETALWKPAMSYSLYSVSKFRSEMEVWRGIEEGLNAVIVNPSIMLGPGDLNRSSGRIFKAIWNGLKFYTLGVTGFVDVRDVVKSMIKLMESDISGERYIISSENLSYKEIFEMIAKAFNRKPPNIHAVPFLTGLAWRLDWLRSKILNTQPLINRETVRYGHKKTFFSNQKIRNAIGIEFRPVVDTIQETAEFFLKQRQ